MAYFERIWAAVPAGAEPERFALRRDFLLAQVRAGERVLDVGCGEGFFTEALLDGGVRAVGAEVAREPLRRAETRRPELELALAPRDGPLPFADCHFDAVWAGELLEHVQDGIGLLGELVRVLRPGGRLIVSTPDHPRRLALALALRRAAFEAHFDPRSDHVRFFTRRSLATLLAAAGFADIVVDARAGVLLGLAVRR